MPGGRSRSVFVLPLGRPLMAADQAGMIHLKNGDRLTCETKRLDRSRVLGGLRPCGRPLSFTCEPRNWPHESGFGFSGVPAGLRPASPARARPGSLRDESSSFASGRTRPRGATGRRWPARHDKFSALRPRQSPPRILNPVSFGRMSARSGIALATLVPANSAPAAVGGNQVLQNALTQWRESRVGSRDSCSSPPSIDGSRSDVGGPTAKPPAGGAVSSGCASASRTSAARGPLARGWAPGFTWRSDLSQTPKAIGTDAV